MLKHVMPYLTATALFTAPFLANASEPIEAWTSTATELRANSAGISFPMTVNGVSLVKSGEASQGGKGVDNVAQYISDDGEIQTTIYVYLPSYADVRLAMYMTDAAIIERFGSVTHRTSLIATSIAGNPSTALRAVYANAADGALVTAATLAQAGRWMVKIRATGPSERRKQVLASLDGLVQAMKIDHPKQLQQTRLAPFKECPHAHPSDPSLCILGTVETADGSFTMFQKSEAGHADIIVPIDDTGTTLAFTQSGTGLNYQLSIHSIGHTELYGTYDSIPNASQMVAIIEGKDPNTASATATIEYAANGEKSIRRGKSIP